MYSCMAKWLWVAYNQDVTMALVFFELDNVLSISLPAMPL